MSVRNPVTAEPRARRDDASTPVERPQRAERARRALQAVPPHAVVAAALVVVLAVALALRLTGSDWDDGTHLHPDERYLSIVADNIRGPDSVAGYFDVDRSPLSPYNTEVGAGYLYGQLPLFATKLVATASGRDGYDRLYRVGRVLSAVVDTLSVLLVFLIARLLLAGARERLRDAGALLAAALYAVTVTAIQHAHFFTVESWLVLCSLLAFYVALRVARASPPGLALLAVLGGAVGLTTSAKISGALVALPAALALVVAASRLPGPVRERARLGSWSLVLLVGAYVAFRLTSPYAFEHSSWLYLEPNEELRRALDAQQAAIDGGSLQPPGYQWLLSQPVVDPLRDLVVWALGVPLGVAGLAGLVVLAVAAARRRPAAGLVPPWAALMLLAFVGVTFLYFGTRFVHSLRYLVPIAPFLCIAAAIGVLALYRRSALVGSVAAVGVTAATLLYALAFVQVYRAPNTRVQASEWIEGTLPPGATIVSEHWDDTVPVRSPPDRFRLSQLPVFDADDETKLRKLYDGLAGADLYALSSPRAWKTIGRLPDRFPIMSRFYTLLADGRLGFREAATFTSPPRLLGVELRDLEAEETFWVYDHPPVILYRRVASPSWAEFRATMCAGARLPGCET